MLRARSTDADRQRELEAVTVTYADQPADLFEVPAGYQKLEMPNMPPGMTYGPPGRRTGQRLLRRSERTLITGRLRLVLRVSPTLPPPCPPRCPPALPGHGRSASLPPQARLRERSLCVSPSCR